MNEKQKTDESYWREKLTEKQYAVLREKGTESAFTGKYVDTKDDGSYHCAACGAPLFSSSAKFDSGTGWPSFTQPDVADAVELKTDDSHGTHRTEAVCKNCGSHLGHVFEDGPEEKGGKRFCINSCSLDFKGKN